MAAKVQLIAPKDISPNPDNPRLIFRLKELEELEQSISAQGILVPLTVFENGKRFTLLDGERRWRCARKLGLHRVPAIIQPKPERVQNIMMMFAIHNARRDWDPLPTALKLEELERQLTKARGKKLTEAELAASASLSRGAVRRYRKILRIPKDIQATLMKDLEDPTKQQSISVDQVIEAVDAAENLVDAEVIEKSDKRVVIDAIVDKFKEKVIKNTVEPRKFGAVARFVKKKELSVARAKTAIRRFIARPEMTVGQVVSQTIESVEQQRSLERSFKTFEEKWLTTIESNGDLIPQFRDRIQELIARLRALL
ncbi:ParB/RepB/Spo0J family partition protein [Dongia sp.]|uniref:ParB/RepB/Spo0J family partition protein n=1 Tax=Dongia sp. TaxID=1977262 RepID=UPI003753BBA4